MLKKPDYKPNSTKPMMFFAIFFVVMSFILFISGMYYQYKLDLKNKDKIVASLAGTSLDTEEDYGKATKLCENNEISDKDQYLSTYIVKKGDTLKSIATNKLGDGNRTKEIENLNNTQPNKMHYLPLDLYPGKKIFLPPEYVKESSGYLNEFNLVVTRITEEGLIYGYGNVGGYRRILPDDNTYYPDNKNLKVEDCIKSVVDMENGQRVLSISYQ